MKQLFSESLEVKRFMSSPIIKNELKLELVRALLEDMQGKEFWIQMLTVLFLNQRGNLLDTFFIEFERTLNQHLNQKTVKLTLANELDPPTMDLIQREVESILGCKVVFKIHMDKDIVGGFIAESDTKYIDSSIRTNVNRFARRRVRLF